MNILLWVLQVALAVLYVSGGGYKVMKADDLVKQQLGLPRVAWQLLGAVEVIGGTLLIAPASATGIPSLTATAAMVLTAETLLLVALFGRRSTKIVAANPFVWAVGQALVVAFVAWGRYSA